jgi:hypothetical protein
MSGHSLHWRVDRIAELMEERAWKELDGYFDAATAAAASGGGFANWDVSYDDFASPIDPHRLFQPFLDMPLASSFEDEIAQLRNARQNIGDAYEWLDLIASDASSWVSDAGGLFHDYTVTLETALSDHVRLLEELERILLTFHDLLEETLKAAKQLASEIIDKLKHMDGHAEFDFSSLLHLGLAVAGALTMEVNPPIGAALIIDGFAKIVDIAEKGNEAIGHIAVHGNSVRSVMESAKTSVEKLVEGVQAKGETITQTLERVPGILSAASTRLTPAPPVIPV